MRRAQLSYRDVEGKRQHCYVWVDRYVTESYAVTGGPRVYTGALIEYDDGSVEICSLEVIKYLTKEVDMCPICHQQYIQCTCRSEKYESYML